MKITPVKGTNDYLPNEVEIRDYLQNEILKVYVANGFEHITTPIIEDIENLDKSDGGENLNLIFKIMKRGDKLEKAVSSLQENPKTGTACENEIADMGLRYDLTLPLSRYFANNKDKLTLPMKCIQMDRVYRAERPQKGRLREFVQCDIDIIGSDSTDSEVELILTTTKALKAIGMKNFKVKINDRRLLRSFLQNCGFTEDQLDSVCITFDKMDKVGYNAVECWGGATFDACLRFLKEDPWDRLRKLRDGFKNTKLQMLFRGQNILGYRPYADDVVEYFVQKSIANGIDIIRIFDCLNDVRNLQTAVTACNKEKGHAQVALSYTLGDAYTLDYWMEMAKKVEDMGADSLCIKDMAGLLVPTKATELIQALKSATNLPIELHTHYTSGVASMTYMKAVEAGCDIIDTAMSPFSMGTSQPATEVMVEAFKGTEFDTGLDQNLLAEIADYFRPMREEALESGLMNPKVLGVNIKTLLYQVPGGMLSNLLSQLKEQGKEDKFEEVLAEVPRVRKDLGEPPLVTPSSQIVGTQAVFNVLMGERYKVATKETKDVLLGKYGQTVKPFNPEIVDKVLGEEKKNAITCRPADLLEPELDKIEAEMKQWKQQDEDVLSYALFPQVATEFFKYREAQQKKVDASVADTKNGAYPV